ncbi:MAG TPA: GNAT family N-acetyltransferase [Rhizobiales bacterium]|nr:GNAT family N-acetyltransferase [Hyphomicrobiales bacterium]
MSSMRSASPQVILQMLGTPESSGGPHSRPTSCGLDFWHCTEGVFWAARFLGARPAEVILSHGEGQARFPVLLRRLPGGLCFASVFPYGAADGEAALIGEPGLRKPLLQALRRHRAVTLEYPFVDACADARFQAAAERMRAVHTPPRMIRHVLDYDAAFAGHDAIQRVFDSRIRWSIRKAEREGCAIRVAGPSDLNTVQSLYERTMREKGAPVNYGSERFAPLLGCFRAHGQGEVYVAERNRVGIGMAAVIHAAQVTHLLQLAVPKGYRGTRAGDLLVSHAIEASIGCGRRYFDFMATPAGDEGLLAYKAKWGAHPQVIRELIVHTMPLLWRGVDAGRWLNRRMGAWRGSRPEA